MDELYKTQPKMDSPIPIETSPRNACGKLNNSASNLMGRDGSSISLRALATTVHATMKRGIPTKNKSDGQDRLPGLVLGNNGGTGERGREHNDCQYFPEGAFQVSDLLEPGHHPLAESRHACEDLLERYARELLQEHDVLQTHLFPALFDLFRHVVRGTDPHHVV